METTMETTGKDALVELLEELRRAASDKNPAAATAAATAERIWPAFKAAVAGALDEMKEEELEGVRNWREGRHAK